MIDSGQLVSEILSLLILADDLKLDFTVILDETVGLFLVVWLALQCLFDAQLFYQIREIVELFVLFVIVGVHAAVAFSQHVVAHRRSG
jgi:hypothetical protein